MVMKEGRSISMEIIVYRQKVTEYLELILWQARWLFAIWFAFDEACLGNEEFCYYLWLLLNHMMAIKERDFR